MFYSCPNLSQQTILLDSIARSEEDLVTFYRRLKQEKVNKKEVVNNDHCACDSNGYQKIIINEPKRVHFAKNLPVYNRPIIVPEQTFYRLVCCQLYWSLINAARKQLKRIHDGWSSAEYMVYRTNMYSMDIVTPHNINYLIKRLQEIAVVEQNNLANCSKQSSSEMEQIKPQWSIKERRQEEREKREKGEEQK
ncbi:hypothetical protein BLOT_012430 [Blomia tropicalis]|nr:hypothetical protein BLOT_012430 [Blomia tropicalis]